MKNSPHPRFCRVCSRCGRLQSVGCQMILFWFSETIWKLTSHSNVLEMGFGWSKRQASREEKITWVVLNLIKSSWAILGGLTNYVHVFVPSNKTRSSNLSISFRFLKIPEEGSLSYRIFSRRKPPSKKGENEMLKMHQEETCRIRMDIKRREEQKRQKMSTRNGKGKEETKKGRHG